MQRQLIHSLWRILYGLTLIVAGGFSHYGWAAPQRGDEDLNPEYIEGVLRQAKAAEIKSFMNESIDPCNDFYEFSCGNWAKLNEANINHLTTGVFERLSDAFDRKVKKVLNSQDEKLDTLVDKVVRRFYRRCTEVTSIDNEYRKSLKNLIKEFGSMPVLTGDSWDQSNFDWLNTTATINHFYGFTIILGTEVTKDLVNNKVNVVYVVEQDFPLETQGMYLDEHTKMYRKRYRDIMAHKLHSYLGVEAKLARTTASELMDFEVQLAKGLMSETENVDWLEISKMMTLEEMMRIYAPTLNVQQLVEVSIGQKVENVYDYNPKYKTNLIKVIQQTSKRILANYIFFRLIDEFSLDVGKTEAKREQNCLEVTRKYFSKALDYLIYRRYNNEDPASDIELIWSELKQTIKLQLQSDQSLNWISNKTRNMAIKKLAAMKLQINSYADENLHEDYLRIGMYAHLNYIDYLKDVLKESAFQARDLLNQPNKPIEASEILSFTPANILLENVIKVPVALLQPYYLWATSYPNAIKFGTLASLIGHELIHGFDNDGRKFDENGNINDWWDEESTTNFENRQRCFTEQYSEYIYNGLYLPETNAQSENIADNGGTRLAHAAYLRWLNTQESSVNKTDSRHILKETLPTLNYTNMQLFFISYAQIWCNDVYPTARNLQVATDQHVPGKFRVIGTLSNFDEFAKEFNCKPGTPMNPVDKCILY